MTATLPITGTVADVEMYTFQGVVLCTTPIGTLVTLTGNVALVEIYACHGVVPCVAVTVPVMGRVTDVTTYD